MYGPFWSKMKWCYLLVFLVQGYTISSQPLSGDDCCPCLSADRITDSDALNINHTPSDCPCKAKDSEIASSILRQTIKAEQSFSRPLTKKSEPKPLLNPEVGLASSVLETLREVTDQEYEEALARDVARSAIRSMEPDTTTDAVAGASENVVDSVSGPKSIADMDVQSEASHNHETRCIHPMLGQEKISEQYHEQPSRRLFKHFLLTKPVVGLQKNIFDMDNSPSEVQENMLPTRANVLDNIKIKTDLLKSKLFLNNDGLTQKKEPKISFDKVFYKPVIKLPDFKLASPLDHLKKSKLFDSYISSSPSAIKKDKLLYKNDNPNNNIDMRSEPLRKLFQDRKSEKDEVLSPKVMSKEVQKPLKRTNVSGDDTYDDDNNGDNSILKPVLALRDDCDLKNNLLHTQTTTEKNECVTIQKLVSSVPEQKGPDLLNTVSSSSDLIGNENQVIKQGYSQTEENCLEDIYVQSNPESNAVYKDNENDYRIGIIQPTENTMNNLSIDEDSEEENKLALATESINENTENTVSGTSIDVLKDPIDENKKENMQNVNDSESITDAENTINSSPGIPNMKEGIKNTIENLKKVNDKWQENLKLNVQDALKQIQMKSNIIKKEKETLEQPNGNFAKASNSPNAISKDHLQKNTDSGLLHDIDNNSEPSESIYCLTPSENIDIIETKDKQMDNNIKKQELTEKKIDIQQPRVYTDISNKDNVDETSECVIQRDITSNVGPKFNSVNNEEYEMEVQASEPKQRNTLIGLHNSRYGKQDSTEEPSVLNNFGKSVLQVNNFFDDVKSKFSNMFSETNEDILNGLVENTETGDTDQRKFKQDRTLSFKTPVLSINNADLFKSTYETQSGSYNNKKNLNPFKARVAIPESLEPIVTPHENLKDKTQKAYNSQNILQKILTSRRNLQSSEKRLEDENTFFKESDDKSLSSESTVLSPNIFKNTLRSESKNLLPISLKDRTETLKNIYKTLGNPFRSTSNRNVLKKSFDHDSLLEVMANKRNELNEKLKSLNIDLNDRLSSLLPFASGSQPLTQSRTISKNRSNAKSKQVLRRLPSNFNELSRTQLLRKNYDNGLVLKPLKISTSMRDRLTDLKLPKLGEQHSLKRPTSSRTVLKSAIIPSLSSNKNLKSSPRSDNKVIPSSSASSPKTTIPRLKTIHISKKIPSVTSTANVPKVLSPPERRPIISKYKSSEPFILASENVMSRAPLYDRTISSKAGLDNSSNESEQYIEKTLKQGVGRNIHLSKLREVLKSQSFKKNEQKPTFTSNDDITPLASENGNASPEGSMRQNVQYKCKMVCTKEK